MARNRRKLLLQLRNTAPRFLRLDPMFYSFKTYAFEQDFKHYNTYFLAFHTAIVCISIFYRGMPIAIASLNGYKY